MTMITRSPPSPSAPVREGSALSVAPASRSADVIVVGGGLSGLTMAAALGTAGVRTFVIDREPRQRMVDAAFDGRTTAIAAGSRRILDGAGVWRHVPKDGLGAIREIRVADGFSPFHLHYDHREVGDEPFGFIVENQRLRQALFDRVDELDGVTHLAGAEVKGMETDAARARVQLADGTTVSAGLIIGADGRPSAVRRWAGIGTVGWDYERDAIVCCATHEHPHHGVALEHFLPPGPFATLPMAGNQVSIVWTERREAAGRYMALADRAFERELERRAGEWLGRMRLVGRRYRYPLTLVHAEQYSARRVALIGDAAHGIHPIAGQGLNLGFRDIAALAELLVDQFRLGLDLGDARLLSRYQRWRSADTMLMVGATDGLHRLFGTELPPVRLARRLGLAAVARMPRLKQLLMRHAMGTVDVPTRLPKLARGEPL